LPEVVPNTSSAAIRVRQANKRDLLGRGNVLVTEHQHVMVEMGAMDAREIILAERPGQVKADHFGAERRVEWPDVEAGKRTEYGGHKLSWLG
jgi:hypothetical protein